MLTPPCRDLETLKRKLGNFTYACRILSMVTMEDSLLFLSHE